MTNEKRNFERLAFPADKTIRATLVPLRNKEIEVRARILNISQGGLGLATIKNEGYPLEEYNELILQGITGEEGLYFLKGQMVKIKWIINSDVFENLGVGCEFVKLSDECFELIGRLCNGGQ